MSSASKTLNLICTAVGLIGLIDAIILGINIIKYFLILSQLLPDLLTEATIAAIATAISSTMLFIGSYFMYKGKENRGAILNVIAGGITIAVYIYYAFIWEVTFLVQLGSLGYILLVPAPLSGILGILLFKEKGKANRSSMSI